MNRFTIRKFASRYRAFFCILIACAIACTTKEAPVAEQPTAHQTSTLAPEPSPTPVPTEELAKAPYPITDAVSIHAGMLKDDLMPLLGEVTVLAEDSLGSYHIFRLADGRSLGFTCVNYPCEVFSYYLYDEQGNLIAYDGPEPIAVVHEDYSTYEQVLLKQHIYELYGYMVDSYQFAEQGDYYDGLNSVYRSPNAVYFTVNGKALFVRDAWPDLVHEDCPVGTIFLMNITEMYYEDVFYVILEWGAIICAYRTGETAKVRIYDSDLTTLLSESEFEQGTFRLIQSKGITPINAIMNDHQEFIGQHMDTIVDLYGEPHFDNFGDGNVDRDWSCFGYLSDDMHLFQIVVDADGYITDITDWHTIIRDPAMIAEPPATS